MRKNVTLTAEQRLIERAREKARQHRTTLNALFRDWLSRYVDRGRSDEDYAEFMARLDYASAGRSFTRDEMNER